LLKALSNVFQSTLYLPALALNKQVDAIMLRFQNFEECVSKRLLSRIALAWNRQGFPGAGGGMAFYQVFEVIVVDIVCE
jgi:hypothetical protein